MRLAYHMVTKDNFAAIRLAQAIEEAVGAISRCTQCGAMSEDELCAICSDESREGALLCVVESAKDILLLEENGLFRGRYFVLERLEEEAMVLLESRVASEGVREIIFALTPSIQNDALMLYVEERLKGYDLHFSRIAQGVPTGVSLENIDILSLAKAIEDRVRL